MTGIGESEFPEMDFSEALKLIEGVKREKVQTTAALGKLMGLKSTNNGYFYAKMAALSKFYGLIERDKTNIVLSPLAKRIVYPVNDADRQSAIRESIFRTGLVQRLYQALGPDYHELDFPTKLLEVSKASHEEIESKSEKVESLYRDSVQFLRGHSPRLAPEPGLDSSQHSIQDNPMVKEQISGRVPPAHQGTSEDFYTFQTGDSFVRLKKGDTKLLHTTKRVIDAWLFAEGVEEGTAAGPKT